MATRIEKKYQDALIMDIYACQTNEDIHNFLGQYVGAPFIEGTSKHWVCPWGSCVSYFGEYDSYKVAMGTYHTFERSRNAIADAFLHHFNNGFKAFMCDIAISRGFDAHFHIQLLLGEINSIDREEIAQRLVDIMRIAKGYAT
jgi:hypothetical protein